MHLCVNFAALLHLFVTLFKWKKWRCQTIGRSAEDKWRSVGKAEKCRRSGEVSEKWINGEVSEKWRSGEVGKVELEARQ